MATVTRGREPKLAPPRSDGRRAVRDSLIVTVGGQLEQVAGTATSFFLRSGTAVRWGLDVAHMGVYSSLRVFLDYANWSSLGVGLGAVQEIPILRAAGKEAEARRVADVAYTAATFLCLIYAGGLLAAAWAVSALLAGNPLARAWTLSLVAVAGLALLHRYQTFLIAVLRAHQQFALTTELAVIGSFLQAALTVAGLWLAGFWGLWGVIAALYLFNVIYLHARQSLRFAWAWDGAAVLGLMRVGLPILANTVAFGFVLNLDKALILRFVPDGARSVGLYTIALMGTGWGLDLAGRIALVMYTYYQTTLGRTNDPAAVALQASRTTEAQAPILAAGAAVAYLVGPAFLGWSLPKYAPGLVALRPLLPGTVLLGLAWPARQMLIAVGRPYRLALATLAGLLLAAEAGTIGAVRLGLAGVAAGMSAGYAGVYLLTSAAAFATHLGWRTWLVDQLRLAVILAYFAAGALIASRIPLLRGSCPPLIDSAARCLILAAWGLPPLWFWGQRHEWGGLFRRRTEA